MRKPCSNHVQTRFSLTLIISGVAQAFPQQCLNPELWICPGLLNAVINQIRCVQTCVCVNVGRGAGIPETMFLLCLITELGHGPSLLEEVAHTRTHALTHLHFHRNQHQHLHLHLYSHLHLHLQSWISYNVDSVTR